jgi:hypothetical protein|tara:strand:- start:1103 stop:1744 length:642 start_codon:yes stop_codon:yes gene_type:complete
VQAQFAHHTIEVSMKNQKLSLLAVVSAALLALSGCAPSDSGGSSGGTVLTGPIADLQGTWVSDCLLKDGTYEKYISKVSGTSGSFVGTFYSDSACTTESYKYSESYVITIGDSVELVDGSTGYKFSYVQGSVELTSLNDLTTQGFNDSNNFGIAWATDVTYNINGKTSGTYTVPEKNTTMYNVYKLDGNNLYYGSTSSTSYPTTVNTVAYVKQ